MKKQLLKNLLQMLGLQQNKKWGSYRIEALGHEFDSLGSISRDFLMRHPNMEDYHVSVAQTEEELKAFIVYRLVDKLDNQDQRKELKLTQEKIPTLVLNKAFMDSFVGFLRAQTLATVYNDLENRILDAMRDESRRIRQDYRAKSALRQHNVAIRKHRSTDADQKWKEVVRIALQA